MSKFRRAFRVTAVAVAIACAPMAGAERYAVQDGRHIIPGVPFVRWSEAKKWRYPDKAYISPSIPAAHAMLLRYWGTDATLIQRREWEEALKKQGWHSEWIEGSSLAEIRALIDHNFPVIVMPAMTPFAHLAEPGIVNAAYLKEIKLKAGRLGMLGLWVPLDELEKFEKRSGTPANDANYLAARVIVGYDQQRKTIFLHDPSLGPVWEVPEEDFDRMWQFSQRRYWVLYPPNYMELLAAKRSAPPPPYAPRTSDNNAAAHYWYGCAHESLDALERAEQELRSGLQLPELGRSSAHLLHLELARVLQLRSKKQEAISEARAALDLMPEDPTAWQFVKSWQHSGGKGKKDEASEAAGKLPSLCAPDAQARFVRSLDVEFNAADVPALGCETWEE